MASDLHSTEVNYKITDTDTNQLYFYLTYRCFWFLGRGFNENTDFIYRERKTIRRLD